MPMTDSPLDVPAEVLADAEHKANIILSRLRGETPDPGEVVEEIQRQLRGDEPGPLGQVDHLHEPTTTPEDRVALRTVLDHRESPDDVPPEVLADAEAKVRALAERIAADTSVKVAYERGGEVFSGYDGLTDAQIVQSRVALDEGLEDLRRRREARGH